MSNILNTRIQLKYDSYKDWVENNPTLLSGEVAIAYLPPRTDVEHTNPAPAAAASATLIKVGPGAFNSLPWLSATAADVYAWAKQEALPVVRNDGKNEDGSDKTAGNVISSIVWEGDSIKYTTASVATSEGMAELQQSVQGILDDIAANRDDWAEKTVDTNTDTQYRFDTDGDKLVVYKTLYTLGAAGTEEKVGEYEFLTESEVNTILADYYTKNEIDGKFANVYTKEEADAEFATPAEVIEAVNKAIDEVADVDSITNITTLVEYANANAGTIGSLIEEVYGASTITEVSRIDTAISDSSKAKTDAAEALSTANTASENATNALNTANSAKEIAETAQDSASASANAAAGSASAAADSASVAEGHAGTASTKAGEASASATDAANAKTAAEAAQSKAEAAQGEAESARDEAALAKADAQTAKNEAEEARDEAALAKNAASTSATTANTKANEADNSAKAAAESARLAGVSETNAADSAADAEAAKLAALDSNTSATAIANEAKGIADAAKEASEAATDAVAGLHAIATSGSIYDVNEVNNGANDTKYFIFYCGTSLELVD